MPKRSRKPVPPTIIPADSTACRRQDRLDDRAIKNPDPTDPRWLLSFAARNQSAVSRGSFP